MIELKQVDKSFGDKQVLKNISFRVENGETLALIGGSGSGKSTLLRMMIGLDRPTAGEIWIDGTEITQLSEDELDDVRLSMGMVFQYSALFDSMTVRDNVAFGLREHTDYDEEKIREIVREKLLLVGLPDSEDMMPGELSGGMKKRVSLARALAFGPSIIFYDEPDSGLDPVMTRKIDDLIVETQKKLGVTSIVVTHDMESACLVANRIAMLYQGEIIAIEKPEDFRRMKDPRIREFLGSFAID
ncbi:MAG: ABC transporter ATP-binding protein [Schwartzia sp.]|nr:ABC transporter ATP-binding protein [Schwartzia sp. (in: firmicutes)]MBP3691561.1 ABC transporter ATP-binding protein [Schwartzia sp. (in: firmicutes)]